MEIQISNRQRRRRVSRRRIAKAARIILAALRRPEAELSIVLVDDPQIAEMNRTFLKREGPTNVIAFPMQEGAFAGLAPQMLGDVVISVDTALRESTRAGLAFEERLVALLAHGILHLCGYDHEHDPRAARRMAAQARRVLARVKQAEQPPCTL